MSKCRLIALLVSCMACSSTGERARSEPEARDRSEKPGRSVPDRAFRAAVDRAYWRYLGARPTAAVKLGYHEKDGDLPDLSAEGLRQRVAFLKEAEAALVAFEGLDEVSFLEQQTLLSEFRMHLFALESRRRPQRDPSFYLEVLSLVPYVVRDYAFPDPRTEGIIGIASGAREILTQARANLERSLPRHGVETALSMTRGAIEYVAADAMTVVEAAKSEGTRNRARQALADMTAALRAFEGFLAGRQAKSTDAHAVGEEGLLRLVRGLAGSGMDLPRLVELGEQDMARNLAALEKAAAELDPRRSLAAVVEEVRADRPEPSQVVAEATASVEQLAKLVRQSEAVAIPEDVEVEVRALPRLMDRGDSALWPLGPFEHPKEEEKLLPNLYYVSIPASDRGAASGPSRAELLLMGARWVWPGHLLHHLHRRSLSSGVQRSFVDPATRQGWAHYAERLLQETAMGEDTQARVARLLRALVHDARYLAAVGIHARGWTIDEAAELFRRKAFRAPRVARAEALRVALDPMVLAPTLGVLMITKLRRDYSRREGASGSTVTLRAFHDQLLSRGGAPLPAIRIAMLGPEAGPPL